MSSFSGLLGLVEVSPTEQTDVSRGNLATPFLFRFISDPHWSPRLRGTLLDPPPPPPHPKLGTECKSERRRSAACNRPSSRPGTNSFTLPFFLPRPPALFLRLFFFSFFLSFLQRWSNPRRRDPADGGRRLEGDALLHCVSPSAPLQRCSLLNAAVSRAAVQTHYSLSNPLHPRLFTPPTPHPFPRCGSATAVDQKRPGCGRADQKNQRKQNMLFMLFIS